MSCWSGSAREKRSGGDPPPRSPTRGCGRKGMWNSSLRHSAARIGPSSGTISSTGIAPVMAVQLVALAARRCPPCRGRGRDSTDLLAPQRASSRAARREPAVAARVRAHARLALRPRAAPPAVAVDIAYQRFSYLARSASGSAPGRGWSTTLDARRGRRWARRGRVARRAAAPCEAARSDDQADAGRRRSAITQALPALRPPVDLFPAGARATTGAGRFGQGDALMDAVRALAPARSRRWARSIVGQDALKTRVSGRAALRRPRADRGRARHREDAHRQDARASPAASTFSACRARPT